MVNSKATTVDEVIKSFPTHNIEEIIGRPTYKQLKKMFKGLKKCAAAIPSTQRKGHFYLVSTNTEFQNKTGEAKVVSKQPAATPTIVRGASVEEINQANWNHAKE